MLARLHLSAIHHHCFVIFLVSCSNPEIFTEDNEENRTPASCPHI